MSFLPTKTDLASLNIEQRDAVTSEAKRLLVLAGAGSGKTKTFLQKVIYLIEEKGVPPTSILAITFTKNAANEMIDRLIIAVKTPLAAGRGCPLDKESLRLSIFICD